MESKVGLKREQGQTLPFVAIFVTLITLFAVALLDYALGTSRIQEAIIAADLAAHAGVQQVIVEPDGALKPAPSAPSVATQYFRANKPEHTEITAVQCGLEPRGTYTVPYCRVTAITYIGGKYFPERAAQVSAVAYLPYGATREGQ